jgi:hypothetical protein
MKIKNAREIDTSMDICNRKFLTKIIDVKHEKNKHENVTVNNMSDNVTIVSNYIEINDCSEFDKKTIEPRIDNCDIVAMYNKFIDRKYDDPKVFV